MNKEIYNDHEKETKNSRGNTLFFIIISCWLLFFIYVGIQGGG